MKLNQDIDSVKCPNGLVVTKFKIIKKYDKEFKQFKFNKYYCDKCKFRGKCLYKDKNGEFYRKSKYYEIPSDMMLY